MKKNRPKSLREKVYDYLCQEMRAGGLTSGKYLNQARICETIQISRAPLRDALIQLEAEGFITIFPRKGVLINQLTKTEVMESYEVLANLESEAVRCAFPLFTMDHLDQMGLLNNRMHHALENGEFAEYYSLNLEFHDIFLDLAGNTLVKRIVDPIKQRLYNFPLQPYNVQWEKINLSEHIRFMESIRKGNREAAASIIKHEQWCFDIHQEYIAAFYGF